LRVISVEFPSHPLTPLVFNLGGPPCELKSPPHLSKAMWFIRFDSRPERDFSYVRFRFLLIASAFPLTAPLGWLRLFSLRPCFVPCSVKNSFSPHFLFQTIFGPPFSLFASNPDLHPFLFPMYLSHLLQIFSLWLTCLIFETSIACVLVSFSLECPSIVPPFFQKASPPPPPSFPTWLLSAREPELGPDQLFLPSPSLFFSSRLCDQQMRFPPEPCIPFAISPLRDNP